MNDKHQLQAMGEHQAEQHMCMAKQIEDLQTSLQECAQGAAKMQEQRDEAFSKLSTATITIYEVERVISELVKNGNGSIELDDLLGEVNYCIGRMLAAAAPKPEASK